MIDVMKAFDMEMLVKLTVSAVLGLAIGLERELKRKPLGLKTCLVISIVSCLLTIVSIQSAYLFPDSDFVKIQMDPLRLAAQIVSGVGFLGAGVILRKDDDTISGLTTAAMVWGAAGIGIATGAGFYIEAIAGVVLLIISVELIPGLVKVVGLKKLHSKELALKFILKNRVDIPKVISELKEYQMKIDHFQIKELGDSTYSLQLKVRVSYREDIYDFYNSIAKIEEIYHPEISG